jgi:hypothetical protein
MQAMHMAALPTSSFRAPAEHHALVHAVAKALTRRPDLAEPLRLLLAQVADTGAPAVPLPDLAGMERRLQAVERQVAEHTALLALQPALHPPAVQAKEPTGTASKAPAEPWTTGEGRQKRLTGAGLAELDRRLRAGEPDAAIAAALGVSTTTVGKRRAAAE